MRTMHTLAILAALIAIPLTTQTMMAQTVTIQPTTPSPVTETRTFALQSGGKLKIRSIGEVKISGWDKDEVALTANFAPSHRLKQHHRIIVKSKKNLLELTSKLPPKRERNEIGTVEMELKVPRRIELDINTPIGSIVVNSVVGKLKAKSSVGSIVLKDFDGDLVAHTSTGDINGSIQNIEKELNLSTSTGNIDLSLLNPNGTIQINVSMGNPQLLTPGAKDMYVKTRDSNARSWKYNTFALPPQTKGGTEMVESITASFGDGRADMKIKTSVGSIVVR
jgi:hypothetical protein